MVLQTCRTEPQAESDIPIEHNENQPSNLWLAEYSTDFARWKNMDIWVISTFFSERK